MFQYTLQEGMHGLSNGLVGVLDQTVLVRCIGPSQLNVIGMTDENIVACLTFAEFTTLIEVYVLVMTVGTEGRELALEVMKCRGGIGFVCLAKKEATEVIRDNDVTRLAIETTVGAVARSVLGGPDDEPKIDGDTLVALGSAMGIILTTS